MESDYILVNKVTRLGKIHFHVESEKDDLLESEI